MSMTELFETIADQVLQELQDPNSGWESVQATAVGLDERCGQIYINRKTKEGIVVTGSNDKNLQYYGGFEYVHKTDRWPIGNHVFYTGEADRVQACYDWLQ